MMWDFSRYAQRSALICNQQTISYGALAEEAERISAPLPPRTLVFFLAVNTMAAIAGYVGFLNRGIVPAMLDAELDEALLLELMRRYRPSYIFLPEARAVAFSQYRTVLHADGYVLLDAAERFPYPLHEDLALLMTTSGSTGSPKFVRQSYENLRENTKSIAAYLKLSAADRAITNLPLHYVYGLSVLHTHFAVGGSVVVTEKTLFQREFWELMRVQEVTNLAGVPYTYAMLKRLRFFQMDLPALHTLTQAGGKLDPELHAAFADFAKEQNKQFVVMYGAAEATARMGYLPPQYAAQKVGAMGIAIPGGRFELIDAHGSTITQADIVGELVYYGANVTLGYAVCGEDLALGDQRGGRYETGDMAQRDVDGFYTIVGRKRRFLKVFGKRVNLQEVEHILRQQFGEREFACAGIDDHLYIFTVQEDVLPEVIPFLSRKLGIHAAAFTVRHIETIPKSAAGKPLYRALEKYYDL